MRMLANSMLLRIACAVAVGVAVGLVLALVGHPAIALMAAWAGFAAAFTALTWVMIGRYDAAQTREHANANDPNDGMAATLIVLASLASIVGVGFLLTGARSHGQSAGTPAAVVGVAGVVSSWAAVHVTYVLRYARLYFASRTDKPIDFNSDDDPDYQDFAYVAFTIGMTYQVSDTNFADRALRHLALRHALVSYVLGAVVLATTINLVVQLASG